MGIRLTIGAWQNKVPGTIGIGLEPGPGCDRFIDGRYLDQYYSEGKVSEIYTYDMVEHVKTSEVTGMFRAWYKVLEINGRVEIGTVDLEGTCKEFIAADLTRRKILVNHFYGGQLFNSDIHLTGYTYEILKEYLEKAGFKNIKRIDSKYKNWCGALVVEGYKEAVG